MPDYNGWKHDIRIDTNEGRIVWYSIGFYRQRKGGWYDEIRYDSHDRMKGKRAMAPYFHIKIQSALKQDSDAAIREIKEIIESHVPGIAGVVER